MEVPAEVYARAPNQMTTIARGTAGVSVKAYDGRTGWRLQPDTPLPLLPLSGGNLTGAAIEAMVWFPAGIQRAFSQWQIGVSAIGGRDVVVAHGHEPRTTARPAVLRRGRPAGAAGALDHNGRRLRADQD